MISASIQSEKLLYGRLAAAALLDLSPRTIDYAIESGDLKAIRIGRRVLISREALVEFVNQGQMPARRRTVAVLAQ